MEPIIWIGGGIAVTLMLVGIVITLIGERTPEQERLERYTEGEDYEDDLEGSSALSDWVNVQVSQSTWGERMARELARADMKFKPGEYLALLFLASFLTAFFAYFFGGGSDGNGMLFGIVGALLGPLIPRFFLRRAQRRRLERFDEQLPDMLNLMVNGLRAGYSQMQALESVSKELPAPISDEFRRVVREIQLGLTIAQALDNLLRRIPSPDLDFIITAINIQRESGGNLAEILDVISYTIRERIRIKREIRVLVSQVIYSGRVLALMPIVLSVVLWGVNRNYMLQFFNPETRACGIPMLVCGGFLIYLGYLAMNRIADIDI